MLKIKVINLFLYFNLDLVLLLFLLLHNAQYQRESDLKSLSVSDSKRIAAAHVVSAASQYTAASLIANTLDSSSLRSVGSGLKALRKIHQP